jgi:hypothetical protein
MSSNSTISGGGLGGGGGGGGGDGGSGGGSGGSSNRIQYEAQGFIGSYLQVWLRTQCPPRHPTHFRPSPLVSNMITRRGWR